MLDSFYHMALKIIKSRIGLKTPIVCHLLRNVTCIMDGQGTLIFKVKIIPREIILAPKHRVV